MDTGEVEDQTANSVSHPSGSGSSSGSGSGASAIHTPALNTVRTRSDLSKLMAIKQGTVEIKDELLDYTDDDEKYDNYQDEVVILDDSLLDEDENSDTVDSNDRPIVPRIADTVQSSIKTKVLNRAYIAVQAARRAASSARPLNPTPTSTARISMGTLYPARDDRSTRTSITSNLGQRLNWSSSFGRPDGLCGTCVGGRHAAFKAVGGGPVALVATDQCFPACLPAAGGECLRIVRVEGGALREIVLALADCIGGNALVKGTVILIGSVSHLADVGTAQYALDWVRSRQWLLERYGTDNVVVLPVAPVPIDGIEGASVIRSQLEITHWFASMDSTEALLGKKSMQHFANLHLGKKAQGVDMNERQCLRLPVSLDSRGSSTFVSEGWGSRPDGVPPLPRAAEQALVLPLLADLNQSFGLALDENPSFERSLAALHELMQTRAAELNYLVIGGSHADRLADALCALSPFVERETTGGWRASKSSVAELVERLTLSALEPDVVVVQCLDNNTFFCQEEDGSLMLPKKGGDNIYHVVGELKVANTEQTRNLAKLITPVVKLYPEAVKIWVSALPRYTVVPCCEEETHLVGRGKEMAGRITGELAGMKRTLRSTFYTEKAGPVRFLDPAEIAGYDDPKMYTDTVHLRESWYMLLAAKVKDLAAGSAQQQEAEVAEDGGRKRKWSGGSDPPGRAVRLGATGGSFLPRGSARGGEGGRLGRSRGSRGGGRRGTGYGSNRGWGRFGRW